MPLKGVKHNDISKILTKENQELVEKEKSFENVYTDRYRIGGNIVKNPVIFTKDEKTFFCCSGSVVKIYNVSTGTLLGVLSGHTARVTSVMVNPINNLQVYTTSHDCTIRIWDYIEFICLDIIDIKEPILYAKESKDNIIYLVCDPYHYLRELKNINSKFNAKISIPNHSYKFLTLNIKTKKLQLIFYCKKITCISVEKRGRFVLLLLYNSLLIYSVDTGKRVKFTHNLELTTAEFHLNQPIIATGDCSGRITLWINYHNAFTTEALQAIATNTIKSSNSYVLQIEFHWHANTVSALAFSEDGSYLLSGADEAVLVFWQIETGNKLFLPRLGAPLLHITTSPCGTMYAVACADNAIRMINAVNNKVIHYIQGLQYATLNIFNASYNNIISEKKIEKHESILATRGILSSSIGQIPHPTTGYISLNGKTGYIQLFDIYKDRHIGNIAVVERNYVSQPRDNTNKSRYKDLPINYDMLSKLYIEYISYSNNGKWLVTTDRWVDTITKERNSLKFWYAGNNQNYILNTRSEISYDCRINYICYHPLKDLVVTTSIDNTFKIWQLQTIDQVSIKQLKESIKDTKKQVVSTSNNSNEKRYVWVCTSIGKYKDLPIKAATFSYDGSILAIAHQQIIALWDPNQYELVLHTTLVHPPPSLPIRWIHFIPNTPYLVSITYTTLYVWNILTCSVVWSYYMRSSAIAVHPTLPYFATLVVLPFTDTGNDSTITINSETISTMNDNKTELNNDDIVLTTDDQLKSYKNNDISQDTNDNKSQNKRAMKKIALLIFHIESPIPIRIIDASDAKYDKIKMADINDKNTVYKDNYDTETAVDKYTVSSLYTSYLAFVPKTTTNTATNTSTTNDKYKAPLSDISSLVYLSRSREIIRIPNALHLPQVDESGTPIPIVSLTNDKERIDAVQKALKDKPSLFTQLYGEGTSYFATEKSKEITTSISYNTTEYGDIHTSLLNFLRTPSHVITSLSSVYTSYMDAFLVKK